MNTRLIYLKWFLAGALAVAPSFPLLAQEEDTEDEEEEIFTLSPFEISADESSGYQASSTLAGTRIRTDLRDIASPISVVTSQFLDDTAARSNTDLLQYTTSTEVGGLRGNFGGFGSRQGLSEESALLRPNSNTRVRGLDQADNTRNFFLTEIPWDSYNVDRIDIQRGPNSILFGVGSPAGIINAQTKTAILSGDSGEVQNELSSFGSSRWSFDYNKAVIEDLLAVRLAGLYADKKYKQEPAFNEDERLYGAITYSPQLFNEELGGKLTIKGNFENGNIEANNPRVLPPWDYISLWFDDAAGDGVNDPIGMGRAVYDPFLMQSGGFGSASRGLNGDVLDAFYVPAFSAIDSGPINNGGVAMWFRDGESNPFFTSRQAPRVFPNAIGPDGELDNTVAGIPFGSLMRSAGWNEYAKAIDDIDMAEGRPSRFPLADRDYYRDKSLTDPTIFNFYNNLIDGDNKRERTDWTAYNLSISQSFFEDRLGIELVYDTQEYTEGRWGMAWSQPHIAIDANANLQSQLPQYDRVPDPDNEGEMVIDRSTYRVPGFDPTTAGRAYANPMAGAAFAFGGANGNASTEVDRDTYRATIVGELNGSDFFDGDSPVARFLGRHVFTGLYTMDEVERRNTQWRNVATTFEWANENGVLTDLDDGTRQIRPIFYLSDPLIGGPSSASGLGLGRVTSYFNPSGTYSIDRFNSNWRHPLDPSDPDYVDPAGDALNPYAEPITQSELASNYVGRELAPGGILNAREGDLSELITNYSVDYQAIDSVGFTWQGYLLDGHLVPTVGWREDTLERLDGRGAKMNGVAATRAQLSQSAPDLTDTTRSWGVVAHSPDEWLENVPGISGLTAFYNEGNNAQVAIRYNFDGSLLANPEATSQDYGFVVRALDDRLSVKLSRFKTEIANGALPGGGNSPGLGQNQFYIAQLEAWGTGSVLLDFFGRHGLDPNQNWYWNWALVDGNTVPGTDGFPGPWSAEYNDLSSDFYKNHPSTAAQKAAMDDFIAGLDQSFFDAYQIPVDVQSLQAAYATGDPEVVRNAVAGVYSPGEYITSIGSESGALINGLNPTGSIDSVSEGYELELNYQPNENWNIQLNAAKTDAYRERLGVPMTEFIEKQYERFSGPAGELRQWWGGDNTIKTYYENNIISALEFLNDQIGQQVPEMRPYRASLVSNYKFGDGALTGFNLGGALRWQDKSIIGYRLNSEASGLNADDPIYGESDTAADLWIGYARPLSDRVDWKVQLNLRNVGEDVGLTTISVNPDGSPAAQRITEGTTWALTNTLSF